MILPHDIVLYYSNNRQHQLDGVPYEYLDYQLAAKFHFHQEIHLSQYEGLF